MASSPPTAIFVYIVIFQAVSYDRRVKEHTTYPLEVALFNTYLHQVKQVDGPCVKYNLVLAAILYDVKLFGGSLGYPKWQWAVADQGGGTRGPCPSLLFV